jgi:hypothetical protein
VVSAYTYGTTHSKKKKKKRVKKGGKNKVIAIAPVDEIELDEHMGSSGSQDKDPKFAKTV